MRALLVVVVLVLLFVLVRVSTDFRGGISDFNPVLLGYGALFAAGIVTAEILRPLLSLMAPTSRFVVVTLIAGLVWFGFDQARQSGTLPEAILTVQDAETDAAEKPSIVRLQPAWDGIYRAVAQVNSQSLGVLIDPASPLVVLQYEEAERLGLAPERLKFKSRVAVSDRKINAALTALLSVRIDDIELLEVKAAIAEKGALETSLIGLSFLNRMEAVALLRGELVLRQ